MVLLQVVLLSILLVVSGETNIEGCLSSLSETGKIFEVLPGLGWDNLRNVEEYRVLDISYQQCRTTADRKFLIPDGISVQPLKAGFVETFAETFDSYHSFSSSTSASINDEFCASESRLFGMEKAHVSGSFSADAQFAMRKQVETNSSLFRVSARYPRYRATLIPDTSLHPSFRKHLHKVAALLEANQTSMAKFETQLMIRDFGTHVVSSVDAGGVLLKEDFISSSSFSASEKASASVDIRLQAGLSFNSFFFKTSAQDNFGTSFSYSEKSSTSYSNSLSHSQIAIYGGPLFKTGNFSIEQWDDGLEANLVAIDRKGTPIFQFINTFLLPELNAGTVYKLENLATQAFMTYYKHNTIYGCRDPASSNFDSKANVDDGTCGATPKTFLFGGTYQECTGYVRVCKKYSHINPRTNDYSCPQGFISVLLWKATKSNEALCRMNLFECDWPENNGYTEMSYSVYWCAPQVGQQLESPGLLFGGLWNSAYQVNHVTRGNYCPRGFSSVTLGLDLTLCYADDIQNNRNTAISFGGLLSSSAGNPLALRSKSNTQTYPHRCPSSFTKYLVTIDEDNEISYCGIAKKSKNFEINHPIRPPYMRRPMIKQYDLTNAIIKMSDMEAASLKLLSLKTAPSPTRSENITSHDMSLKQAPTQDDKPVANGHSNTTTVVLLTVIGGMVLVMLVLAVITFRRKKNGTSENVPLLNNN